MSMGESINNSNQMYHDRLETPLNACSLETLQGSLSRLKHRHRHPLIIGCYQLNEGQSSQSSEGSSRSGALLLHSIPLRVKADDNDDDDQCSSSSDDDGHRYLKFGEAVQVIETEAGILDGKWLQSKPFHFQCNGDGNGDDKNDTDDTLREVENYQECHMYAAATAKGNVVLYRLVVDSHGKGETLKLEEVCNSSSQQQAQDDDDESESESDTHHDNYDNGLALSLAWDEFKAIHESDDQRMNMDMNMDRSRIVSSYSNGTIAVHEVEHSYSYGSTCTSSVMMNETHRWNGHTLFGCPSEVWTACFANNKNYNTYADTVISGGDDCILKLWDLRTFSCHDNPNPTPVSMNKDFDAGVTAVTYHPSLEHVFAVGSYDESVRIWDMRRVGPRAEPLAKIHVGGGVWRIKWHPTDEGRILVGAMHGGCRVVMVPELINHSDEGHGDESVSVSAEVTKAFTEHKSMAYGADWLYDSSDQVEAAASCSFYDRQAFIWETS